MLRDTSLWDPCGDSMVIGKAKTDLSANQQHVLENKRIKRKIDLLLPTEIKAQAPITEAAAKTVREGREEIEAIISGEDDRLLVVIGPCSIHDIKSATEYAKRLVELRRKYADKLCIIMRVYFEKPRTTVGWKGLMLNPDIVGEDDPNYGRLLARQVLLEINNLGLPCGTEVLNPLNPQYIDDLIAWGAIGARTAESQTHREIASGLSFPVGIKNGTGGTDGSVQIAMDAMVAANEPSIFFGIDPQTGKHCGFETTGNPYTQLILRGGSCGPNYYKKTVRPLADTLRSCNLNHRMIVDCSHANSGKDPAKQGGVLRYVIENRDDDTYPVWGVMLESHLFAGKQKEGPLAELKYGQSITDACIDWEETESLLEEAYNPL